MVTAHTPFEPEAPSGNAKVTFEFDHYGPGLVRRARRLQEGPGLRRQGRGVR